MSETILQNSPASSATVPLPASPPPGPKCSNGSIDLPDLLLPSAGLDWGQAHARYVVLPPLRSPAQVLPRAFPSASPPALPSLPWYSPSLGLWPSPVSSSVHSSFENCYSSSRVDLLISDCTFECVLITGSLARSVIGDRPSHLISTLPQVAFGQFCNRHRHAKGGENGR